MPSVHDRHGRFQQSLKSIVLSGTYDIDKVKDDLTHFEYYPPCSSSTFSYVNSVEVARMTDDGEDFTLQMDWGAMVVFGFEAFAADFC